jgi:hypothetical protein
VAIGELQQQRLDLMLGFQPMALDLDVEPVAEDGLEAIEARLRERDGPSRRRDRWGRGRRVSDQPVGVRCEPVRRGVRGLHVRGIQMRAADELHEVGVARLVHGEKGKRPVAGAAHGTRRTLGRIRPAVLEIDVERDADDRLDARLGELVGKLQRAEQIVSVKPSAGNP